MRKVLGALLIGMVIFAVSAMAANKPLTDQQLDAITAGGAPTITMTQTQTATATATNSQTGDTSTAYFKAVNVQKQAQAGLAVIVVVLPLDSVTPVARLKH